MITFLKQLKDLENETATAYQHTTGEPFDKKRKKLSDFLEGLQLL